VTLVRDNLKWYRSIEYTEGASHGGAIDTSSLIVSASAENIFDNVSDDERESGDVEYRKIYLRNENTDDYANIKGFISQLTTEENTEIEILAGGSTSLQGEDSAALSGTFTFAASTEVICSVDISKECRPGEKIFNSTDDTNTAAKAISAISADGLTITLASAYAGTAGSSKAAKIAPITGCTFVSPLSAGSGDALVLGTLGENESIAVWIKRTVTAAGDGSNSDSFKIKVTNT
jgi:hypothetical protein